MTAAGSAAAGATGHYPVMAGEISSFLDGVNPGSVFDGTVGLGGHAFRILQRFGTVSAYVGADVDGDALARAAARLEPFADRAKLFHASYERAPELIERAGLDTVDAVILDLGASTMQFKTPERGFSFAARGPLDMRMDRTSGPTAADILARSSACELKEIFSRYGEFRWSGRLARLIASARVKPDDTVTLAGMVESVVPARERRKSRIHPATKVFQALRIAVNDELGRLERALPALLGVLSPGGLLMVISFHSLEDRLVKRFMKSRTGVCTCPSDLPGCVCGARAELEILTKRPLRPGAAELAENRPSRSARLRVARKL